MPLDITGAVSDGFERATARNGIMLMAIFFGINILNTLMTGTPITGTQSPPFGGAGVFVLGIVSIVVAIGTLRTLAGSGTRTLDPDVFQRNIAYVAVNMFIGGIVFGLIVMVGIVLLIIPGIFLLVSLLFWNIYVAVEDQNFVDALKGSWALTKGNRWQVAGLLLVVGIISLVVNAVFAAPAAMGVTPRMLDAVLLALPSGFTSVFSLAVLVDAYQQLTAEQ